ncbi:cell surface A33 antigen-like isoform X1 [Myxocyprinus asiaticus]|uniref:cell surface A33 antigen-like isoform X1 n=1 Tax=Myxocyprinus asiaticus TaxID=70543 RepID=UPI0022226597|nr:cell surface A33 antigen-like isoform X1 [Myxocyprinus asiaticus]
MTNWKLIFCSLHLMSVMSTTFGLDVTMSQAFIEVARGEDVTFTCNFKPKNQLNELIIITWSGDKTEASGMDVFFGTYYSNSLPVDIGQDYVDRAIIETDLEARKSTLLLKQVTLKESRKIKCSVQIPGDIDGQPSDTTSLLVQVPPSQPICKVVGTAEYGYNISLTCVSEEGSPTPTYKWEGYDVKNSPRPHPPKTNEKNGVLSLFNVSMDTSGFYVCLSSNKLGSSKCNLTLSVMPSSMNLAATVGIIGGCIAGIVLLVIIICCCCKRKQKPEEYEVGAPVVQYHDKPPLEKVEDEFTEQRKLSNAESTNRHDQHVEITETNKDKNANLHVGLNVHPDRSPGREDHHKRYDDYGNSYTTDRYEDRQDRYDDRKGSRDDLRDRYDDRKGSRDDLRDRYDDRRGSRDDLRNRYDDRKGSRDDLRDWYDDRKGSRDDLRDRYDDRKGSRDDLRDRYDDRKGSRDDLRDRYDDRRGSRDDLRDRYDDRKGSRDDLRDRYR